jgi:C4-dicarboxylate transporter DctQ subunit
VSQSDGEDPVKTNKVADLIFIRVPYLLLGTILLLAIGINFANIVGRYVFSSAIYWAEEILAFMVVWAVFIALPSITYRGAHLKMDLFSSVARSPIREILGGLVAILMIVASAYVVYQSANVIGLYMRTGTRTFTVGVPLIIPNLAVPVGFALVIVAILIRFRSYLSGRF